MLKPNIKRNFLDSLCAIEISNEKELEEFKIFLGASNVFTKDGKIASQLKCTFYPTIFYMNATGVPKYLDTATREYLEKFMCRVWKFSEVNEPEQVNFFGDDNAGVIRKPDESLLNDPMDDGPIEADAKVVKDELSLDVILDYATVGKVNPATCDGLIVKNKDEIIKFIKQYDNIVVTKDNYTELKNDVVKKFKDKISDLENENKNFNKEVTKYTKPFSDANLEVRKAIKSVLKLLIENIAVFEEEEKERQITQFSQEFIVPRLIELLQKNLIEESQVNDFQFNDKWLKRTSAGNLTKATKEGIDTELNRLTEIHAQKQKDIETIKSTVETLAAARGIDKDTLKAETYLKLYESGYSMPQVQQQINMDLETIQAAIEREKERARIEAERKQREAVQAQTVQPTNTAVEENAVENIPNEDVQTLIDEKTGEVAAFAKNNKISIKRIATPDRLKGKTYTYTYEFSGDFGTIKTFSNILKILSKISDFKYTRK